MSRTKLMKLRPARSRICCRDRGKVSRKTDVRKVPYQKVARPSSGAKSPLSVFRKRTLNPPKETMVPLTREDFQKGKERISIYDFLFLFGSVLCHGPICLLSVGTVSCCQLLDETFDAFTSCKFHCTYLHIPMRCLG